MKELEISTITAASSSSTKKYYYEDDNDVDEYSDNNTFTKSTNVEHTSLLLLNSNNNNNNGSNKNNKEDNNNNDDNDLEDVIDLRPNSIITTGYRIKKLIQRFMKSKHIKYVYTAFFVTIITIGFKLVFVNNETVTTTTTETSNQLSSSNKNKNNHKKNLIMTDKEYIKIVNEYQSFIQDGYRPSAAKLSDTYIPRGRDMTVNEKDELTTKWGQWKFDPSTSRKKLKQKISLPIENYPNGDVPYNEFPDGIWQKDPIYLSQFLPESIALVERSMEAILAEYGQGKEQYPDKTFDERSYPFTFDLLQTRDPNAKVPTYNLKNPPGNAGYATQATLAAIQRRLLHAIITEDTFNVVLGGHSAAAGHGNNFQQSYVLQLQYVIEPILARLGVYYQSYNFGMGGLGTAHNVLGAKDLYGTAIDIVIWDAGMTEGMDTPSRDLFVRQLLLSGTKKPVILNEPDLRYQALVPEIGSLITGFAGVGLYNMPRTESFEQVQTIPWATRYLNCTSSDINCNDANYRFNATCWITRTDFIPTQPQKPKPGSQVSWHPGNRAHQLVGRIYAFLILQQLHAALTAWNNSENYVLSDSAWHVTDEYRRMEEAVTQLTDTSCGKMYPATVCNVALNSRSEFTPRYNPYGSSLRSILMDGVKIMEPVRNAYDPPDVRIPQITDPPTGQIDIIQIIENGVTNFTYNRARRHEITRSLQQQMTLQKRPQSKYNLPPGQGWALHSATAPNNCDGTWDSFCARPVKSDCLLLGHNDFRGGLLFDSYSGWIIVNLQNVVRGFIMIRLEDWGSSGSNWATTNFQCENNYNCPNNNTDTNTTSTNTVDGGTTRLLGGGKPVCEAMQLEFAINGKITIWNQTDFEANRKQTQRVVHLWVLLDDPNYFNHNNNDNNDVELAIRLNNCQRILTFTLSHVYWA